MGTVINDNNEEEGKGKENNQCYEQYDTSALISMGILSEEVITEMLIPLANEHVTKCRKIFSTDKNITHDNYMKKLCDDPIEVITELLFQQQQQQVIDADDNTNDKKKNI